MAILIAVANQKGGCGKTTTVMNLAGGLVRAGYRVMVADADKQASATIWSVAKGQGRLPFAVTPMHALDWKFSALADREDFDLILIDCPPGAAAEFEETGKQARAALRIADVVLVPLQPSTMDFSATLSFVRFLGEIRRPAHQLVLALVNGFSHNRIGLTAQATIFDVFAPLPHSTVLQTTIGRRTSITAVSGAGQTIFEYDPRSEACREYTQLTKEIITCLANLFPATTAEPELPPSTSPTSPRSEAESQLDPMPAL